VLRSDRATGVLPREAILAALWVIVCEILKYLTALPLDVPPFALKEQAWQGIVDSSLRPGALSHTDFSGSGEANEKGPI